MLSEAETALGQTLDLIAPEPDLAQFQFRNANIWVDGSHNRSTIKSFYGAGREDDTRAESYVFDKDEASVLLGEERAGNPVEYLLHVLAGCMTTTMFQHANLATPSWLGYLIQRPGSHSVRGIHRYNYAVLPGHLGRAHGRV